MVIMQTEAMSLYLSVCGLNWHMLLLVHWPEKQIYSVVRTGPSMSPDSVFYGLQELLTGR